MPDVRVRVVQEFPRWFKQHASFLLHFSLTFCISLHDFDHIVFLFFCGTQMMNKARERPEVVNDELLALAHGPHSKVKTYSICHVNLVRFVTAEHENVKKTQISGVMVAGDHTGDARDFYGVLKEIKE